MDLTDDGPTAKPPLPCVPQDDVVEELIIPVPAGVCMFDIIHVHINIYILQTSKVMNQVVY